MRRLAFLLTLLLLLAPRPAYAQGGITVLSSTARADFPQAIAFTLEAKSKAEITQVSLRYRIRHQSCADVSALAVANFKPGREVKATWVWDMRQSGGLPPGVVVQYQWVIEDSAGGRLDTAPTLLNFKDDRYRWQMISGSGVTIFWYEGDRSFAEALLSSAQQALEMLDRDTGARLVETARIYVYGSFNDLRGALLYAQEWTGGVTFTRFSTIAIGISPRNLEWGKRALAHELSHMVVGQITFNCYGANIPRWLDEGLAMYAEGSLEADYQSMLNQAVAQDRLISVRSLSSTFPADTEQAQLSYAESHSLVSYLVARYGQARMLRLLEVFREGSSYDDALRQVYGLDSLGLDNAWRASLGLGPRPAVETPPPTPQPSSALPLERVILAAVLGWIVLAVIAAGVTGLIVRRYLDGGRTRKH